MTAPAPGFPLLAAPLRLRGRTVRNRIVFCAHLTNLAADGTANADHAAYYAARARGGAALIVTEEHTVHASDRPYEKLIRGYDPAAVAGHRRITDAVHAEGAVILAQLNHNGAQGSSLYTRRPLLAPSAVWDPMFKEVPKPLGVDGPDGIGALVSAFAHTARRCRDGGFDGVELQCSQASLIRQFLAPQTNRRTDGYGGALPGRARFLLEAIAAVRAAVGPEPILGVRLAGDERVDGGIGVAETAETARLVEQTGAVDYINTTMGMATSTLHLIEASMATAPGFALHVAAAVKAAVALPVLGVGRFTRPAEAEAALASGACDLVGVVRGQIADPGFAAAALGTVTAGSRRPDGPIRGCSGCNQECIGRVGFNLPIRCLQNPAAGRERTAAGGSAGIAGSAARRGRVVVVGGGPAGMQAAAVAAERGLAVTLYERGPALGGQIALAARAPYRGGLAEITRDLERRCTAAGVRVECGVEVTAVGLAAEFQAGDYGTGVGPHGGAGTESVAAVVLATGAGPDPPEWARRLPAYAYADVREVLAGAAEIAGPADTVGAAGTAGTAGMAGTAGTAGAAGAAAWTCGIVLVIDGLGFHPATSVAELLAARGCAVTVCTEAMVVGQDLGVTLDREGWLARAHAAGIEQRTDLAVAGARMRGARVAMRLVHHPTGRETEKEFDHVVYAGQQRAEDTLWREWTAPPADSPSSAATASLSAPAPFTVYRIGDALAPRRADAAIREGQRVGEEILGGRTGAPA